MCLCSDEIKKKIFNELKKGNRDTLIDFYNANPQLKFYKYRSGTKRDIEALKENKIWMGCAAYMDDEYDSAFIPKEDYVELYQSICNKEPKFQGKKYENVMKSRGKVFQKELYLCSLGETATNEDLWMRYGSKYSGFCIEYNAVDLIRESYPVVPVYYGKIDKSIFDLANNKTQLGIVFDIFMVKEKLMWSQQSEWRMFAWYSQLGIKAGDKGILIEGPVPTKIFCGKHASDELKEELNMFCNYTGISIVYNIG